MPCRFLWAVLVTSWLMTSFSSAQPPATPQKPVALDFAGDPLPDGAVAVVRAGDVSDVEVSPDVPVEP